MKKNIGIIWNIIGIIVGIVITVAGNNFAETQQITRIATSVPKATEFGGDFYTYEYEATRVAAKNIDSLSGDIYRFRTEMAHYCGTLLIVIGVLVILRYGGKLVADLSNISWKSRKSAPAFVPTYVPGSEEEEQTEYAPVIENVEPTPEEISQDGEIL